VAVLAAVCTGCGPNILDGEDPTLVGTWKIVDADEGEGEGEGEGKQAEEGLFSITADRIIVDAEILEISGIYGVNATQNPKQIDILVDDFEGGLEAFVGNFFLSLLAFNDLRVLEGIYEVDETSLRIFMSPRVFGRPGSFPEEGAALGTGQVVLEATRVQ
jgi:hypothetical protein